MQRRAFIRLPGRAAASSATPQQRQGDHINRRTFLAFGAGTAAVSLLRPLAAGAQQLPVIGYIGSGSAEVNVKRLAAFRKGLADTGFVEGRNVAIELRWAGGREERMPELVADLIQRRVALIATPVNNAGALAAKAATSTIPIVFSAAGDPVALGLVASLNRPGGNVTGVHNLNVELTAKRLGLLRELVPRATRLAGPSFRRVGKIACCDLATRESAHWRWRRPWRMKLLAPRSVRHRAPDHAKGDENEKTRAPGIVGRGGRLAACGQRPTGGGCDDRRPRDRQS
jgi:hypothetical protein